MKLRKLQMKDAEFMLEWMHDESVVKYLHANFAEKTILDCREFIKSSENNTTCLHMAIVDENDTYMGTISLKYIRDSVAEFAISIRNSAMGKGYSSYGMKEIIKIGFEELKLEEIYWCVSKDNKRAIRFYDKNEYQKVNGCNIDAIGYSKSQIDSYFWYHVINNNK